MNEEFMKTAVIEAKNADCDIPVGAVIVKNNRIITSAHNEKEKNNDITAHAEIIAIKKASEILNNWRLDDCEMYITLEPCQMCAGAIVQARIKKVYMGAMNPKAGCAGSVLDLLHVPKFNHQVETYSGILGEECSTMLSEYFRRLRKK